VGCVRLTDVNEGQHHENEALQQHDQDVENCPDGTCQNVAHEGKQNVWFFRRN